MSFKSECCETNKSKEIVCEENKRKMTFLNPDRLEITKVHVDGCEITDNSTRCDYLVVGNSIENYVELKGQDIKHAIEQLEATIRKLSKNQSKYNKRCFVISTRCPISSSQIQIIQKKFKKKYNSTFRVKNKQHTERI